MEDFVVFNTSMERGIADVVEITREIKVEPENVAELLQSHDKALTDVRFLLHEWIETVVSFFFVIVFTYFGLFVAAQAFLWLWWAGATLKS